MVRALTEDIADLQQMGEWFYSLPLLYYDAEQQRYCLCALLRKFLLYRLHNASFLTQWDSYHRCGCWYREHGETKKAVAAFYKVLDYAGILSCDLTGLLFEKFDKLSYNGNCRGDSETLPDGNEAEVSLIPSSALLRAFCRCRFYGISTASGGSEGHHL